MLFLIVALRPYRFQWPSEWRVDNTALLMDTSMNFLAFLPFGFFFSRLSFVRSPIATAGIYCLLLSLLAEVAQLFLPRYPSLVDLTLNTAGGVVGASVSVALARTKTWFRPG